QPLTARSQLAQPRPRLLSTLGAVTMQLGHQPRDQHRILVIAFVTGVVLSFTCPTHQHRVHTHQRHIALSGKLIEHHPAMPGRLTPHRHTTEPMLVRHALRPLQHRTQFPRPSLHRLAGQHLRIVITHHHRLLLIRQINTDDHMIGRHQPPQLGQLGITALVTTRQTTTLGHDALLHVIGTRTRQRHQEGVATFITNTPHSSLTTDARGSVSQRSCFLSTFPIALRGRLSTTRTSRGRLCTESCWATYSISSSGSTSPTMNATMRCPRSSSGRPTTAASATPGCPSSAASTSPAPTR